jgi:hypothetical protein
LSARIAPCSPRSALAALRKIVGGLIERLRTRIQLILAEAAVYCNLLSDGGAERDTSVFFETVAALVKTRGLARGAGGGV